MERGILPMPLAQDVPRETLGSPDTVLRMVPRETSLYEVWPFGKRHTGDQNVSCGTSVSHFSN